MTLFSLLGSPLLGLCWDILYLKIDFLDFSNYCYIAFYDFVLNYVPEFCNIDRLI